MNIFKEFFRFYKKKQNDEKAKRLILKSEICEELVKDLTHIVEENPNTQIIIEPLNGGKIIIKSRLTDSDLYQTDDIYKIPQIQNTISIANAIRGK